MKEKIFNLKGYYVSEPVEAIKPLSVDQINRDKLNANIVSRYFSSEQNNILQQQKEHSLLNTSV
ncbi:hypothetical protein SAMN05444682_112122 [Parapedobacter indicus]|uniref:Uncharacterized protein n=1 Tax=Parapedobacter indicus TaxID=1477437 RepID=A0A1I3TGM7_9SPHI|nr:hypothetical protein CLV26_11259 [Parapedobacter indicus]SFJ68657.1 hypothetical protein SAMN05444682_112122 [Parapedobacter indicus]